MGEPVWHVVADAAAAVTVGAERLVAALRAADLSLMSRDGRGPRLGIPGGSALAVAVRARAALDDALWARTRLVLVDERRVDADDPASNYGAAERAGLFDRGRPAVVLRLVLDGEPVSAALSRVQAAFASDLDGALDVALLGMGPDGHVASLFPERPAIDGVVGFVEDAPKPPPERLTLGRAALATATSVVLVATGAEKRGALARLAAGDPTLPAVGLAGLEVVTDQAGLAPRPAQENGR